MNEFILKIRPSNAPHDEKERRFRDVLEFLLYSTQRKKDEGKETAGKIEDPKSASQTPS